MITLDSILDIGNGGLDANWAMSAILSTQFFDSSPYGVIVETKDKDKLVSCFGEDNCNLIKEFIEGEIFEGSKEVILTYDDIKYAIPMHWRESYDKNEQYLLIDFQNIVQLKKIK
jgi:hypothetical protein